jgi:hypothetical protein
MNEKQVRNLVRAVLNVHGLQFQENIHGEMIKRQFHDTRLEGIKLE